ncbi:hypothetical protein AAG570_013873 [Ranatra chinensis]|uniref:Uncharacterized protein n=1 Tax=Ranatra chinensis TaxID=642074 RepID=A0ABD0YDF7_9HEMI
MASKRRKMFHKNKTQETTEKGGGTSGGRFCIPIGGTPHPIQSNPAALDRICSRRPGGGKILNCSGIKTPFPSGAGKLVRFTQLSSLYIQTLFSHGKNFKPMEIGKGNLMASVFWRGIPQRIVCLKEVKQAVTDWTKQVAASFYLEGISELNVLTSQGFT